MNNISPTTLASNGDSEEIIDFNPDEYTLDKTNNIQKKGEEMGTKLLFPMILMLGIVMVFILVPALLSFQM